MQTWHTGAHRETIPVKKCRKDLSGQQNIQNIDLSASGVRAMCDDRENNRNTSPI
jgi:hypothetical protein